MNRSDVARKARKLARDPGQFFSDLVAKRLGLAPGTKPRKPQREVSLAQHDFELVHGLLVVSSAPAIRLVEQAAKDGATVRLVVT